MVSVPRSPLNEKSALGGNGSGVRTGTCSAGRGAGSVTRMRDEPERRVRAASSVGAVVSCIGINTEHGPCHRDLFRSQIPVVAVPSEAFASDGAEGLS